MSDMKDIIADLQKDYIKSLPDKIRNIETLYNKQEYEKVIDCFHKIKGSGQTYYMPEVSVIGAMLEEIGLKHIKQFGWAVPKALYLLQQVYSYRLSGRVYAPEKNADFQRMLAFTEQNAA